MKTNCIYNEKKVKQWWSTMPSILTLPPLGSNIWVQNYIVLEINVLDDLGHIIKKSLNSDRKTILPTLSKRTDTYHIKSLSTKIPRQSMPGLGHMYLLDKILNSLTVLFAETTIRYDRYPRLSKSSLYTMYIIMFDMWLSQLA